MATLSRIGRRPVPIPKGVKVEIKEGKIVVEGPKGKLEKPLPPMVEVTIEGEEVRVMPQEVRKKLQRKAKAFQGLTRALINNMVTGVSQGFTRSLDLVGLGYRAEVKGDEIIFHLGYSHPINFKLPPGVKAKVEKGSGDVQARVVLEGIDKEVLGETAARIKRLRPPEPYKGKGIRYTGEQIIRKAGKAGKAGK
ncbi:LSU ribosomal protein L6p (L9e) [Thermosulfurimonas dismutans]|uniref:Large ribosomal subunit protein uL6 n=1 Tax=Thermosulfurimonas dismutans TaxID=999894 RepID=A0A179D631_9BACT|nr:50S ribosomal protein L6 [Thermosulfurimonas dismutans]OAQ21068.1 LSU ribosomal protein L6p (L9e) [Thermosulfurimonas dismutans]